jgi:hypothetical protein
MHMTALEYRYPLLAEALHEHADIIAAIDSDDCEAVVKACTRICKPRCGS